MTTLSKHLRHLMDMEYLSEIDLARLAKLPQPTVHHILSGATKKPRRKTLEGLANAFSISIGELLSFKNKFLSQCVSEISNVDETLIIEIKKLRKEIESLKICLFEKL